MSGEIRTPDEIRADMFANDREIRKGPAFIESAEIHFERIQADHQRALDVAYRASVGTVEDRKAEARLDAGVAELLDLLIVSRAKYGHLVRTAKVLDGSQMMAQSVLKSIKGEGA